MSRWPLAVAALLALGIGASGAQATTFVVSTTTDALTENPKCEAPCSLRQAITDANKSPEKENIVEIPSGEYALEHNQLAVSPLAGHLESIIGLAARADEVVIKGENTANSTTVLSIGTPGAVAEVDVSTVKITESHSHIAGGAITVASTANVGLSDVAITGNFAKEMGGGIQDEGRLSIANSVIASNQAEGTSSHGGGIDITASGSVLLVNSTIAGNSAVVGGGGIYDEGEFKAFSATIAGNEAAAGGGLAGGKPVELTDTILAMNGGKDCSAEVKDPSGHNLADDASCKLTQAGDKSEVNSGLVRREGAPKPTPLLADNGGPTETIALEPTSNAIVAASELLCPPTDQRGVARPPKLCDIGAFQLSREASSPPPPNPKSPGSSGGSGSSGPSPPPAPTPVLGKTGTAQTVSGTVLVKLPGTQTFVPLSSLREVPFGTIIDATHGRVLVTTVGPHGGTQTGEFFEGEFVLTQSHNGLVQAALAGGDFSVCPTARERSHIARAARSRSSAKHVVRKLWANAHGSFSTKGNYAAGAVQGTEWLTEDHCDGTLIRVTRDRVLVTNLVNHHHRTVKAGHRYFAKAP